MSGKDILENCKNEANDISIFMAFSNEEKSEFKMQYIIEYRSDVITMKDGIAYTARGISKQGSVR